MSRWSGLTSTELMILREGLCEGFADGEDLCGTKSRAWQKRQSSSLGTAARWLAQDITAELADRGHKGACTVSIAMGAFCGYHRQRDVPICPDRGDPCSKEEE